MRLLMDELNEQPGALRQAAAFYEKNNHLLDSLKEAQPKQWVLTGMGASYHAAWIAALHLKSLGAAASAVEATDLFNYAAEPFEPGTGLIYISQSGSSGEVNFLRERRAADVPLIAVTNTPGSPLAQAASRVLPMEGGEEAYIASKTYLNPLAILWLAAQRIAGVTDGREYDCLREAADRAEALLNEAEDCSRRLLQTFDIGEPLLFLGHGPHAATARQAAMILSEWAKVPALNFGIGAFRHGFIEAARPGMGVVIFSSPGRTQESARRLAAELAEYGARVLRVENGRLLGAEETPGGDEGVDEFLAPVLDIVPIQIWTERLARERGIEPGFRYISKVVRSL